MKTEAATQQIGMNQEKFEGLFSKYRQVVYRTALGATGNKQDALDIQQDIFLQLIDQGNTLDHVSSPEAYLSRMALNEARQRFRTRKRRWPPAGVTSGPATRCSSTPAGAACGVPTTNGTPPASRAPAWRWPGGSPITGWR